MVATVEEEKVLIQSLEKCYEMFLKVFIKSRANRTRSVTQRDVLAFDITFP